MPNRLKNKTAIVTGASSGFGRDIALAYAAEGANVVCADIDPWAKDNLEGREPMVDQKIVMKYGGGRAMYVRTDVRAEADIKRLITMAIERYGRLDIMVNNAGISPELLRKATGPPLRIHDSHTEESRDILATNLEGVFFGCKHACAQFLRQEAWPENSRGDKEKGWIVNIASLGGLVAIKNAPMYTASKHGVVGLTKQVAADYAKDRIHCNAICPGMAHTTVTTDLFLDRVNRPAMAALHETHPWGLGEAFDITGAALFLVSDEAQWVNGVCLSVDGGATAAFC